MSEDKLLASLGSGGSENKSGVHSENTVSIVSKYHRQYKDGDYNADVTLSAGVDKDGPLFILYVKDNGKDALKKRKKLAKAIQKEILPMYGLYASDLVKEGKTPRLVIRAGDEHLRSVVYAGVQEIQTKGILDLSKGVQKYGSEREYLEKASKSSKWKKIALALGVGVGTSILLKYGAEALTAFADSAYHSLVTVLDDIGFDPIAESLKSIKDAVAVIDYQLDHLSSLASAVRNKGEEMVADATTDKGPYWHVAVNADADGNGIPDIDQPGVQSDAEDIWNDYERGIVTDDTSKIIHDLFAQVSNEMKQGQYLESLADDIDRTGATIFAAAGTIYSDKGIDSAVKAIEGGIADLDGVIGSKKRIIGTIAKSGLKMAGYMGLMMKLGAVLLPAYLIYSGYKGGKTVKKMADLARLPEVLPANLVLARTNVYSEVA